MASKVQGKIGFTGPALNRIALGRIVRRKFLLALSYRQPYTKSPDCGSNRQVNCWLAKGGTVVDAGANLGYTVESPGPNEWNVWA